MTLEELQQAIAKLSPGERAKLREWLVQFEADRAEPVTGSEGVAAPPGPESSAEKLGRLAGRAFAGLRKRVRET